MQNFEKFEQLNNYNCLEQVDSSINKFQWRLVTTALMLFGQLFLYNKSWWEYSLRF